MGQVALDVHLRLFAVGWRGQRDHAEHARTDAFGDRLNRPALAGAVAALEDDTDLQAFVDGPQLQLDQLAVQFLELLFVFLALHGVSLLHEPERPRLDHPRAGASTAPAAT